MRLDGEIVVADSRQVYERLDIATNKPSDEQRRRVRYHMIDFVDPAQSFNAAEYVQGARAAIDDIASRGRLPIVEGGTMLYVDALCDGFNLTGIPPNPTLRAELEDLEDGALRERLLAIDPDPGVDLKNPVRMIRAIEILEAAGPPLRALRTRTPPPWQAVRIGLTAGLDVIDGRLDARSRQQVARGLVVETQAALDAGVPDTAAVLTGIGYAEALAHIRGELTLDELPQRFEDGGDLLARQVRFLRDLLEDFRLGGGFRSCLVVGHGTPLEFDHSRATGSLQGGRVETRRGIVNRKCLETQAFFANPGSAG